MHQSTSEGNTRARLETVDITFVFLSLYWQAVCPHIFSVSFDYWETKQQCRFSQTKHARKFTLL